MELSRELGLAVLVYQDSDSMYSSMLSPTKSVLRLSSINVSGLVASHCTKWLSEPEIADQPLHFICIADYVEDGPVSFLVHRSSIPCYSPTFIAECVHIHVTEFNIRVT